MQWKAIFTYDCNGHYLYAAGNMNKDHHRSWYISQILHGQDKGANLARVTWESRIKIWITFKTFIELRITHPPSKRICVRNNYFQHILLLNPCLLSYLPLFEYSSFYIEMINFSLLILAHNSICWKREPNVRVQMRMLPIVFRKP